MWLYYTTSLPRGWEGSAVFSKLDLRWGFHENELDAESRDITAFAIHDGIFRYKRLSFVVNAAPEKYQHIITQSMAGLQGVANIADHLIVHGRDTEIAERLCSILNLAKSMNCHVYCCYLSDILNIRI